MESSPLVHGLGCLWCLGQGGLDWLARHPPFTPLFTQARLSPPSATRISPSVARMSPSAGMPPRNSAQTGYVSTRRISGMLPPASAPREHGLMMHAGVGSAALASFESRKLNQKQARYDLRFSKPEVKENDLLNAYLALQSSHQGVQWGRGPCSVSLRKNVVQRGTTWYNVVHARQDCVQQSILKDLAWVSCPLCSHAASQGVHNRWAGPRPWGGRSTPGHLCARARAC